MPLTIEEYCIKHKNRTQEVETVDNDFYDDDYGDDMEDDEEDEDDEFNEDNEDSGNGET